ncbi:hypothetical protein AKJ09_05587 [Labilithrix luteola]|uniref:Outer membrane protein beta-barrel domain-containing protein n=2 Tax=Labilithrix luteola TaxID=1391654 RepID=A0A0K1PZH0_9BACT|nr:hypothetical protein AKJ09_05587 [Labilithrix luteola]
MPLFSYTSTSIENKDGDTTTKVTQNGSSIALLWGDESNVSFKVHTVPRVGVDYTIIDRLTLGGSVAVAFGLGGSTKTTVSGRGTSVERSGDSPSTTVVGVAPRVGYILPVGDVLALWLRGGFSFYSVSEKTPVNNNNNNNDSDKNSATLFSIDLDPQLTIVPMEHFFFTVGPLINIPLTGNVDRTSVRGATTTTVSNDLTQWHFGISAGLGGWFNL